MADSRQCTAKPLQYCNYPPIKINKYKIKKERNERKMRPQPVVSGSCPSTSSLGLSKPPWQRGDSQLPGSLGHVGAALLHQASCWASGRWLAPRPGLQQPDRSVPAAPRGAGEARSQPPRSPRSTSLPLTPQTRSLTLLGAHDRRGTATAPKKKTPRTSRKK